VKAFGGLILAAALVAGGAYAALSLRDPETTTVTVTKTATVEGTPTVPGGGLPPAVETTRAAIEAAARTRDLDALRALIPADGFTYSYGGPYPGGAIAYWQHLDQTTKDRPFETLAAIMVLPLSLRQGLYVWPFAYGTPKSELTEYERGLLGGLVKSYVGEDYYGWRAGIRPDGTWVFFVAGD
jgi:hypothetical protein